MSVNTAFPKSPHDIIDPKVRWYPGAELIKEKGGLQTLLPPLVHKLRIEVKKWRDTDYSGATTGESFGN